MTLNLARKLHWYWYIGSHWCYRVLSYFTPFFPFELFFSLSPLIPFMVTIVINGAIVVNGSTMDRYSLSWHYFRHWSHFHQLIANGTPFTPMNYHSFQCFWWRCHWPSNFHKWRHLLVSNDHGKWQLPLTPLDLFFVNGSPLATFLSPSVPWTARIPYRFELYPCLFTPSFRLLPVQMWFPLVIQRKVTFT